jgi:hypothetical protein
VLARVATQAGESGAVNEDYAAIGDDTVVVLDGLTARTETGCIHGVRWYVEQLANAIIHRASLGPREALATAIEDTADQHRSTCDLTHPGTPAAAVAIAQFSTTELRYLVLCDTTLTLDTTAGITIVTDPRMGHTAPAERAAANASPVGSPEKAQALTRMKHVELAARNTPEGYWVASSDPTVAKHAITSTVRLTDLHRTAILTDGATRLVEPFGVLSWAALLDLLSTDGPDELLRRTRAIEEYDPTGIRWPRNKKSDDATVVYLEAGYAG